MKASSGLQKLLASFVFRDSRLESHPKVSNASVFFLSDDKAYLELVVQISRERMDLGELRLPVDRSLAGRVYGKNEASLIEISPPDPAFTPILKPSLESMIAVPIRVGSDVVGALNLASGERDFFDPRTWGVSNSSGV